MAEIIAPRRLFVCQGNVTRSFWAERVFRKIAEDEGLKVGGLEDSGCDIYVASAGIYVNERDKPQSVQLVPKMVSWASEISPMDEYIRRKLVEEYGADRSRMFPVYIDDNAYGPEDTDVLCEVLFKRLRSHVFRDSKIL